MNHDSLVDSEHKHLAMLLWFLWTETNAHRWYFVCYNYNVSSVNFVKFYNFWHK